MPRLKRGMTARSCDSTFPRRDRARVASDVTLKEAEGAGNTGCFSLTHGLVCKRKHTSSSPQVQPLHRRSLRDGVNAYLRALPGVRDLIVTVARQSSSAHLAPAQGCQDHTISPSAANADHRRAICASALRRPSHPAPRFRDDRPKRPSYSERDGADMQVIWGQRQAIFCKSESTRRGRSLDQLEMLHEIGFQAQAISCSSRQAAVSCSLCKLGK
jgi:hypothetical protein